MKKQDLYIYQGDTHVFTIDIRENGATPDLHKTLFVLEAVADDGSVVKPAIVTRWGRIAVVFDAAATAAMERPVYEYELKAVIGNVVSTYMRGKIHVTKSIFGIASPITPSAETVKEISIEVGGQGAVDTDFVEDLTGYLMPSEKNTAEETVSDEFLQAVEKYLKG